MVPQYNKYDRFAISQPSGFAIRVGGNKGRPTGPELMACSKDPKYPIHPCTKPINLKTMIKTNDWFLERLSDRIIPASIFGFILGLGLSNPDDIKVNKLRYIKIVFITMITVIFLALLIPKKNSNSNLNNDCKWTKVPGRYSEPDC